MKHKDNGEHSPWTQKRTPGSKEDGKHSEHHAQADASKQKGKAMRPEVKRKHKGMKTLSRAAKRDTPGKTPASETMTRSSNDQVKEVFV